ncbi:hypothetical protein BKA93DRAFT_342445 [Sparassis latifolia]
MLAVAYVAFLFESCSCCAWFRATNVNIRILWCAVLGLDFDSICARARCRGIYELQNACGRGLSLVSKCAACSRGPARIFACTLLSFSCYGRFFQARLSFVRNLWRYWAVGPTSDSDLLRCVGADAPAPRAPAPEKKTRGIERRPPARTASDRVRCYGGSCPPPLLRARYLSPSPKNASCHRKKYSEWRDAMHWVRTRSRPVYEPRLYLSLLLQVALLPPSANSVLDSCDSRSMDSRNEV